VAIDDLAVTLDRCTMQNGQVTTMLPRGVEVRVIALSGDWAGCSIPVDGREEKGWIARRLLAKVIQAGYAADGPAMPGPVRDDGQWRAAADTEVRNAAFVGDLRRGDTVAARENAAIWRGNLLLGEVPQGAQLRVITTQGNWIGVLGFIGGREQEGWVERRFLTTAGNRPVYAAQPIPSVYGNSTITFENQSGDSAVVRLVGPTRGEVFVPNGGSASIDHVAAGSYVIYIRYGNPGQYRFTRGDRFEVEGIGRTYSTITITLHKVPWGNYGSRDSSENEFNQALQ
jgi:hypothetical protein